MKKYCIYILVLILFVLSLKCSKKTENSNFENYDLIIEYLENTNYNIETISSSFSDIAKRVIGISHKKRQKYGKINLTTEISTIKSTNDGLINYKLIVEFEKKEIIVTKTKPLSYGIQPMFKSKRDLINLIINNKNNLQNLPEK